MGLAIKNCPCCNPTYKEKEEEEEEEAITFEGF
jgi:hypothetical protein